MDINLTDTTIMPSGKERSMFDTPIPGQSLTKTPGLYPWDKPPRLNTSEEALEYYIDKFDDDANGAQLLSLLEAGIPVSTLVDSLLLAGFAEGLYNPDVAVLLGEDLGMFMMYLADQAEIQYKVTDNDDANEVEQALEKITNFKDQKMEFDKYNAEGEQPEMPMEESSEKLAPTGLMARQETM